MEAQRGRTLETVKPERAKSAPSPYGRPGAGARLRVLHVGKFYPPHRGGIETVLVDLCAALQHHVDVEVVVSNQGRSTVREVCDAVSITRLGRWWELQSTSFNPGLVKFLRSNRWDVIHIHHPNPMAVVAFLIANPRARLVLTYHSDIVRQRLLRTFFDPILRRILGRSEKIHVGSRELLESSQVLRPFRDRAVVIPFGIREERVTQLSPAARELAAELRAWGAGRLALFVGRIVYYKGLEYLLEAMRSVDGRLLVIGDGERLPAIRKLSRDLGLAERVRFLGSVDDDILCAALEACDFLVLPSIARSEAFGLVLLEAMACRKPLLTTALPTGVAFVNQNGETGIVVPPADREALSAALRSLFEDEEMRLRMGRAARARFEREFAVSLEAERMVALYESLEGMASSAAGPRLESR